jgi:UDP-N-acetylglucosamine 4-epimerase
VTGAAGFIGSHLVESLLQLGQQVRGLDNFATGRRSNLDAVRDAVGGEAWKRFELVEGDIRDLETCRRAAQGCERVLHQAAIGSVPRSIEDPVTSHTANVDGTFNVMLAAKEAKVGGFVYASSSSVYGDSPKLPKTEDDTGNPLSPYAVTKAVDELYGAIFHRTYGFPAAGLRYFNVVGARQDPEGPYAAVVPRWLAALARGQRPVIYGDGKTSRDFCPVANVVQVNLLAASSPAAAGGKVYNVALGKQTTLNQLFEILRKGMAARGAPCQGVQAEYQDFRPGDIRHSLADTSAARKDLGYAPTVDLPEGLTRAIESQEIG